MSESYVVAVGTACMDEYYSATSWVEEGDKLLVTPMEAKVGGMIPNAASVLAGYGNHVYLLDYMNGGEISRKIQENLSSYGLDLSCVETDERLADAKCMIVLTKQERTILVVDFPRPARQVREETLQVLRNAEYVYTTMTEMRRFEHYEELADDLRSHGVKLAFDLEPSTFEDRNDVLFSKADVLFFNRAGLEKYCAGRDADACLDELLHAGVRVVVTTLGADGCDVRTQNDRVVLAGIPTEVCDTTGAGDTFNSSFVHCLIQGYSLEKAARFSNAAAARSTEIAGPKGGVASVAQVEEYMRRIGERGCE